MSESDHPHDTGNTPVIRRLLDDVVCEVSVCVLGFGEGFLGGLSFSLQKKTKLRRRRRSIVRCKSNKHEHMLVIPITQSSVPFIKKHIIKHSHERFEPILMFCEDDIPVRSSVTNRSIIHMHTYTTLHSINQFHSQSIDQLFIHKPINKRAKNR